MKKDIPHYIQISIIHFITSVSLMKLLLVFQNKIQPEQARYKLSSLRLF